MLQSKEKDRIYYEYEFEIISVKMKVKFPCKMKLEHNGRSITEQVTASQNNTFCFKRIVNIKQDSVRVKKQAAFDINIVLITDKGANYISGILTLSHAEFQAVVDVEEDGGIKGEEVEGRKTITAHINKCLDKEALCEIKVLRVKTCNPQTRNILTTTCNSPEYKRFGRKKSCDKLDGLMLLSPRTKKNSIISTTKSQTGSGGVIQKNNKIIHSTKNVNKKQQEIQSNNNKVITTQSILQGDNNFIKSPRSKNNIINGLNKNNMNELLLLKSQQQEQQYPKKIKDKFTQSLLSYNKQQIYQKQLKEKYKKQAQTVKNQNKKRLQQLQTNQNNYKIQIMKLKLKIEKQQNDLKVKNEKISSLQIQLSEINKKQLDIGFLKELNTSLQHKVRLLNQSISDLKKENGSLKKVFEDKLKSQRDLMLEQKQQFTQAKQKAESDLIQLQEISRKQDQTILILQAQLKSSNKTKQMQKNQIIKLETHWQKKLYDFEKALRDKKDAADSAINQLNQNIALIQRQKKALLDSLNKSNIQKEKLHSYISKIEYHNKTLLQQQATMKEQIFVLKGYKDKYHQLTNQVAFLKQDKQHLKNQLGKESKANINQTSQQYDQKIEHYKTQISNLEQNTKTLTITNIGLESQINDLQNHIERIQKHGQPAHNDELSDLKNKQKETKAYSYTLQQQNLSLKNQLLVLRNKLQFGDQVLQSQMKKLKQQIEDLKEQLNEENKKYVQINQKKSTLEIQLKNNKIQLQYAEEKIQKLTQHNKQIKQSNESKINELEDHISELLKSNERKQNQSKQLKKNINSLEGEKIQLQQKLINAKKSQTNLKQKLLQLESNYKTQQQQLSKTLQTYKLQLNTVQNNFNTFKQHQHIKLQNQKLKLQKILQIKQTQVKEHLLQNKKIKCQKQSLQGQIQQLKNKRKKDKQAFTIQQMKLKEVDRQGQKFKDLIVSTIQNEFVKMPCLGSGKSLLSGCLSPTSTQTGSLHDHIQHFQTNSSVYELLISNINDSKRTLFKLVEHNKQLRNEVYELTEQTENEVNKYHFSELQRQRQVQQYEQEMCILYKQKEDELLSSDRLVSQLSCKLYEQQNLTEQVQVQRDELEYALSALKLDFETNNEQNYKQVEFLRNTISQLEEKLDYCKLSYNNMQNINHSLHEQLDTQADLLQQFNENYQKALFLNQSLQQQKNILSQTIQKNTKDRKKLLEKISICQIQLVEELQLKNKYIQLLQQQQKRVKEQKDFVSLLIKQKQQVIKMQLEKVDQIMQLQTAQIQLKRDNQIKAEECQRIRNELYQVKKELKKMFKNSNSLQTQLIASKDSVARIKEKFLEKQKQCQLKDSIIAVLDNKYKQLAQKNYRDTIQLHSQIDSKYAENINISTQTTQKITLLQAQIQELQHAKAKQHNDYLIQGNSLEAEKDLTQQLMVQNDILRTKTKQLQNEQKILEQQIINYEEQLQQTKHSDCILNDQITQLKGQLAYLSKQKDTKIKQLIKEYELKCDGFSTDAKQKQQQLKKQHQSAQNNLQQKIKQLEMQLQQFRNNETGYQSIRKNYEEKIKCLQVDRLGLMVQKNNEIKRLEDDKQLMCQNLNALESRYRESSEIIENFRKRLSEQQRLRKQANQKLTNEKTIKQAEVSSLVKKQLNRKNFKEDIFQRIWSNERQVRKIIQNHIIKIVGQFCDSEHINKIKHVSNGLQAQITAAMMQNIDIV